MIPIDQTIFSSQDGSVSGNCFASCIASLLEVPLDTVPEFQKMKNGTWYEPFKKFLADHGYRFRTMFYFPQNGTWDDLLAEYVGVDGYFICGGSSPRTYVKAGHAVIYKNKVMVHDPHESRAGLVNLEDACIIERI